MKKKIVKSDDEFLGLLEQISRSDEFRRLKNNASDHPTDEELYDYVLDWLSEDEKQRIRKHIAFCGSCAKDILQIRHTEKQLDKEFSDMISSDVITTSKTEILQSSQPSFISKLKDAAIEFITDFWQPFGAGELANAADIPEQKYDFITDHGTIEMSCSWYGEYRNQPAYIRIVWKAHIAADCELVARFVNPETNLIRSEIRLGKYRTGTETITQDELGFDPSNEKWAVAILLVNLEQ